MQLRAASVALPEVGGRYVLLLNPDVPVLTVLHHVGDHSRADLAAQLVNSKLLFARKHYGLARRAAIRGALVLGHAIRLAAVAPLGLAHAGAARRRRAVSAALAVTLGLRAARSSHLRS